MKKITMTLSDKSISEAIEELRRYEQWVKEKTALLCEKLAIIGAHEASVRFTTAVYDGDNDVDVEISPIENGWVITARGQAVAFLEFGAGVYHNPAEPYPKPRPEGIVGIGEYGKGYGKRPMWGFYDESGDLVLTRGNPAVMGMWYATQEMEREILKIAREVFAK